MRPVLVFPLFLCSALPAQTPRAVSRADAIALAAAHGPRAATARADSAAAYGGRAGVREPFVLGHLHEIGTAVPLHLRYTDRLAVAARAARRRRRSGSGGGACTLRLRSRGGTFRRRYGLHSRA